MPRAIRIILLATALWLTTATPARAMQPPPPPLDAQGLAAMLAQADLAAVVTVAEVRDVAAPECGRATLATVTVERCLSRSPCGPSLRIREAVPADPAGPEATVGGGAISAMVAGPRPFFAEYHVGERLLVFLEKTGEDGIYRPLGSGSYDRHLGVFRIEAGGVRPIGFGLAPDVAAHAVSEAAFLAFLTGLSCPGK